MAIVKPVTGDIVSFQLVQNGIIGDERVDVKVDGVLRYQTAKQIDPELNVKHNSLFPYFRNDVNNIDDPSVYDYVALVGRNGQLEVIGLPWINASTFRNIQGRIATLSIDNWREDFAGPVKTFMTSLGASYVLNVLDK
jgi:hypothetical protein